MTYYLGDMITKKHLLSHDEKWYRDRDIDLHLSTRALSVDAKKHTVIAGHKGKKKKFEYDKLLVATGSTPIFLKSFPYDPAGIIGMRNYSDSETLKRWAKKGKKAIIIGAGFVGLKTAYGLAKQGVHAKVVELLPTVLGRMTDLEASARIVERLTSHKLIEIELNNSVTATRKQGDKYVVTYQNGAEESADFIVASVGVKACVDFLEGTGVELMRGTVKVNERQETTAPDIYAAGDVCISQHIMTKEWIYNAIWPVAAAQGRVAAANMAGDAATYAGNLPMNSVDFFEMWITAIGNVQAEGPDIETLKYISPRVYQKLFLQQGIPIAFMAVGNVDGAGLIRGAIVSETPWKEFVKKPQAKVLPIAKEGM
jgi:NAD(P)H-nitrite reductase large subunit